ncbi:MAG: hypothetical protein M0C28_28045 [Candidatus Moduliflexus flocculans]|nr:hypothetical protein [Candidatus Moduliflexus flocculans]
MLHCAGLLRARVAALAVTALAAADLLSAHAGLNPTVPAELVFRPPPLAEPRRSPRGSQALRLRLPLAAGHRGAPPGSAGPVSPRAPARGLGPPAVRDGRPSPLSPASCRRPVRSRGQLRPRHPRPLPAGPQRPHLPGPGARGDPGAREAAADGSGRHRGLAPHEGPRGPSPRGSVASLFPEPIRVWHVPGALPRSWVVGCSRSSTGRRSAGPGGPFLRPGSRGDPPRGRRGLGVRTGGREPGRPAYGPGAPRRRGHGARLRRPGRRLGPRLPGHRRRAGRAPLRANVAFRAVRVPAGRHAVEMRCRPGPALEAWR